MSPTSTTRRLKGGARGPKRFTYTYATIAKLLGMSPKTLQNAVYLKKLDPADLESVMAYAAARRAPRSRGRT